MNQYYEKNLTTGVVTTSYYLGGKLVSQRESTTLRYVHQDSLNSTSAMTASDGTLDSSMTTYPYGLTRTGDVNTDKKFTGQRLDSTGLYYYRARYYDPTIGRFISPDTVVQNPMNPQTLNRYSYCLNNPLKYVDPSGHEVSIEGYDASDVIDAYFKDAYSLDYFMSTTDPDTADMIMAWYLLCGAAPELTSYLEDRPETILYRFYDCKGWGGRTGVAGGTISLDYSFKGNLIETAIAMGHEGMHSAFRVKALAFDSYAEEAFAYSISYFLYTTFTGSCSMSSAVACKDFNPYTLESALEIQLNQQGGIRDTLINSGYSGFMMCYGLGKWLIGSVTHETLFESARLVWPVPPPQRRWGGHAIE